MSTKAAASEDIPKPTICSLCLSIDRNLLNIGENFKIYQLLAPQSDILDIKLLICWECRARLQNIQQFQSQVATANEAFVSGQLCSTLSRIGFSKTHIATNLDTEIGDTGYQLPVEDLKDEVDNRDITFVGDVVSASPLKINYEIDIDKYDCDDEVVAPKSEEKTSKENTVDENSNTNELITDVSDLSDNAALDDSDGLSDHHNTAVIPEKVKKRVNQKKPRKFKRVTLSEVKNPKNLIIVPCDSPLVNEKRKNLKFKCEACDFYFDHSIRLTKHNKFHCSGKDFYCCHICSRGFTSKHTLEDHIKKHKPVYVCKLCDVRMFTRKGWGQHMKNNHIRGYECLECGLRFESRVEVKRHIKAMHHKYICDHCGIYHWKKSRLEKHMTIAHSTSHKCEICGKSYKTRKQLGVHKLYHKELKEPLYCVECDLKFYKKPQYDSHCYNRHSRPKKPIPKVPCPECGKVFHHKGLKDHYDFEHLKVFKYRCEPCDKVFRRKTRLTDHNNRHHLGIIPPKNKVCNICGRGFAHNQVLINHMRTHTGERPYQCECGAAFAQRTALLTHKKSRHNEKIN